jgi:DNA-binding PadR family transcriptional regulator
MILRLIRAQPTWGYSIIKAMETHYEIQLGHSVLYPLLNALEESGFVQSKREKHGGRIRKIYEITSKGNQLLDAYHVLIKEQIEMRDIKESAKNEQKNK